MVRKLSICVLFCGLALTCGCHRSLFPKNEKRTQFDDFDTLRHGQLITKQPDMFGVMEEPALRNRLGRYRR
ncbi:hypothetical protein H8D29_04805 [PVC group bacterium]|nr:hypothetical protein [PVC group bacterium]